MLPKRSISSAPKNPTSTTPRWTFIPITSRKPLQHVARYQIRGSAKPTAVSIGLMFMTPISKSALSRGAWVRWASTQATWGNPRPTTTTSPSRSSLAPAAAIISDASTSGILSLNAQESKFEAGSLSELEQPLQAIGQRRTDLSSRATERNGHKKAQKTQRNEMKCKDCCDFCASLWLFLLGSLDFDVALRAR